MTHTQMFTSARNINTSDYQILVDATIDSTWLAIQQTKLAHTTSN